MSIHDIFTFLSGRPQELGHRGFESNEVLSETGAELLSNKVVAKTIDGIVFADRKEAVDSEKKQED